VPKHCGVRRCFICSPSSYAGVMRARRGSAVHEVGNVSTTVLGGCPMVELARGIRCRFERQAHVGILQISHGSGALF